MKPFHHLILALFLAVIASTLTSLPLITDFQPERDTLPVTELIKAEWHQLFTLPEPDLHIISTMLISRHPGDWNHWNKKLFIKVLLEQEQCIGFITYYYADANTGHIELLVVNKEWRGKGLSKILIDDVIMQIKKQGCQFIQLYVYSTNPHAIDVYMHLGFKVKNRFPGYLLLTKEISII